MSSYGPPGDSIRELKVCLLGDAGVGKSCLVHRFVSDMFNSASPPTIGAAFMTKMMIIGENAYKFNIWDTAGQERFKSLAPLYYRDAAAAILVYDITSDVSFHSLRPWIRELQRYGPQDIVIAIAGNKCDKADHREVPVQEAQEFANSVNAVFAETSALTSQNVQSLFEELCGRLPQEKLYSPYGTDDRQDTQKRLQSDQASGRRNCCSSE